MNNVLFVQIRVPFNVAWSSIQRESLSLFALFYKAKTEFGILMSGQMCEGVTFRTIAEDLKKAGNGFDQLSFKVYQLRCAVEEKIASKAGGRKRVRDRIDLKDFRAKISHLETAYKQCAIGDKTRLHAGLLHCPLNPEEMVPEMKFGLETSFQEADIWVRHALADCNDFCTVSDFEFPILYPPPSR